MNYTIQNEELKVVIKSFGAELSSIQTADGTEYLWQADPEVWKDQAPNIFPYVARMTEGKYTFEDREYSMKIHGFINNVELSVEESSSNAITFRYDSNEETLRQYPFTFTYRIRYSLCKNVLTVENRVDNLDEKRMYFGIGGHPGFRVPLEEGLSFEDYYLEFSRKAHPYRIGFTPSCFINGQDELFELKDGRRMDLHHDMFDQDAIVLKYSDRCVKLASDKGSRSVTVSFPDYPVIGFWHKPNSAAPYVCIEPWSSLPSRDGVVEDFAQQADLVALDAKKTYSNSWTIQIQ